MGGDISAPMGITIQEPDSIGTEFIEWAEKYWHIDKLITIENPDTFNNETCDYKYMRKIFIEKINSLIANRLGI